MFKGPLKDYPARPEIDERTLDRNTSLAWMLELVGERRRVLDVGCATGYLAKLMTERGCTVSGLEINPAAAEEARQHCASMFVADLNHVALSAAVGGELFDVVVFGDVLEHLHDPASALDDARSLLSEDGFVVASIPNIAHGAIRLALLNGHFDYQELGILDETHLHFFTGKTVEELFLRTGYRVDRVERTKIPLFEPSNLLPAIVESEYPDGVVHSITQDPDHDTLQFVVKAFPLTNEARYRAVAKRFLTVNTDLAHARTTLAKYEAELERLRAENRDHASRLQEAQSLLAGATTEMQLAQEQYAIAQAEMSGLRALRDGAAEALEARSALVEELAEKSRALWELNEHAHQREIELTRVQERLHFHERHVDETQAKNTMLTAALEAAKCELGEASAQKQELEERLLAQTNDLLAKTRAETEAIAKMLHATHSSSFWAFKRFLRRVGEVLRT